VPAQTLGSEPTMTIQASLVRQLLADARQLSRAASGGDPTPEALSRAVLSNDSYRILALHRLREFGARHWALPGLNHGLRILQSAVFGVEIGKDVSLGQGVYFVHPVGVVIGGNARVGDRVRFYGNNTVGTAKDNGYPIIEDDVIIGAGARILGPITVGARAEIGANAVVLNDVPADSVVVGMPARALPRRHSRPHDGRQEPAHA
jgi:serine O-acetyltransferase